MLSRLAPRTRSRLRSLVPAVAALLLTLFVVASFFLAPTAEGASDAVPEVPSHSASITIDHSCPEAA